MKIIALATTLAKALKEGFHYGHVRLRQNGSGISPMPIGWVSPVSARMLPVLRI
jgi:hypothetical protein